MSEVLVLVDHVDGAVRKTTTELLTIAARLGEPSAVLVAAPGSGAYEAALPTLAAYGAAKVYRVESADVVDHLVAPTAEVLAQLVERTSPAAVLVPSSADGKEIAARLAIKTGSACSPTPATCRPASPARSRRSRSSPARTPSAAGSPTARRSSRSSPTRPRRRPAAAARWPARRSR